MTSIITMIKQMNILWVVVTSLLFSGCTSPPSVAPLLQVAEQAILNESGRIDEDIAIEQTHADQTLTILEEAYRRDLEQVDTLTPEWVQEATAVYVAAREAVLQNQADQINVHRIRADNLRSAALATRRARRLIEQQDRLLHGVVGDDLSDLLNELDNLRGVNNP